MALFKFKKKESSQEELMRLKRRGDAIKKMERQAVLKRNEL